MSCSIFHLLIPLLSQVQAIITFPKLAKEFNKSDLKCSELIEGKAHAAAAKVILPISLLNVASKDLLLLFIIIHRDELVREYVVIGGKVKERGSLGFSLR
jgi:hypothetical protein